MHKDAQTDTRIHKALPVTYVLYPLRLSCKKW